MGLEKTLDAIKREGRREGRREGLRQGLQEGIREGKREGLLEGKQEGKREAKEEVAKQMISENLDPELIARVTGFSLENYHAVKGKIPLIHRSGRFVSKRLFILFPWHLKPSGQKVNSDSYVSYVDVRKLFTMKDDADALQYYGKGEERM